MSKDLFEAVRSFVAGAASLVSTLVASLMPQSRPICLVLCVAVSLGQTVGCMRQKTTLATCGDECYSAIATQIEYPEVTQCSASDADWAAAAPLTLANPGDLDYWNLSLEETVEIALSQSKVIRDLGGAILRAPVSAETYWDPAVIETDPRFGVEAALSAFDAELSTSAFGEKNDKALNNEFFGGGTRILNQDAAVIQGQLAKRSAIGTQYALRHIIDYDANNAPSNLFPSAWNVRLETEARHPLLQGGGADFNRIAGPNNVPGVYNGVLIARVNTDVELADFEIAVRDLVSNIENAYWDLYYAYRDLDAKIAARDSSLATWRRIHALYESGRRGGEAEKEAQAREQYYRFQEEVQNALSGRLIDGTSVNNGSSGGTFRAGGGVQVTERRLRMLVGLPPSDGRLIRPADEPVTAPIHFDWSEITRESLVRRAELRRQRWMVRRFELEHIASKNYLLPTLDAVGRYRWRGFGHDLLDSDNNGPRFQDAYGNLTGGDFQEWQLGLEFSMPLGFRRGAAAVRNAELLLCRSRAVLQEQEHLVLHDAANAVAEFDRAAAVLQTTAHRLEAARAQSLSVAAAYDADKAPLDLLLEAHRRLADAESRHFQSLAEYAVAIKNVHYAKGTLLDYDGVELSESGWPAKAYRDAAERERLRGKPRPLNYMSATAPRVSDGPYNQHPMPPGSEGMIYEGEPVLEHPAGESIQTVPELHNPADTTQPKMLPAPAPTLPGNPASHDSASAAPLVDPAVAFEPIASSSTNAASAAVGTSASNSEPHADRSGADIAALLEAAVSQ
jgi:hypothetical protein